jgi:hypothetical protein
VIGRVAVVLVVATILLPIAPPAVARVGLAEWEIETPGGHLVSHADPWVEQHGTCLRQRGAGSDPGILVEHVEWWQYYPDYVAGRGQGGYFLLHEPTHALSRHPSEAALEAALRQRGVGAATSARLTPADGWQQAWRPVLESRCRQLQSGGASAGLSPSDAQAARELCRQLGIP